MNARTPVVFISHASEEKERVLALKRWLDSAFDSRIAFFVSADFADIPGGREWREEIKKKLKAASLALLFVSRSFLESRWCFIELGGAYFRDLVILPLCDLDVSPRELPSPIDTRQGYELRNAGDVDSFVKQIAEHLSWEPPQVTAAACDGLQRQIGIVEQPGVNAKKEEAFESYCSVLVASDYPFDRIAGVRMLSGLRTESALRTIVNRISYDDNRLVREAASRTLRHLAAAYNIDVAKMILDEPKWTHMAHENAKDCAGLLQSIGKPGDIERIENTIHSCGGSEITKYLTAVRQALEQLHSAP